MTKIRIRVFPIFLFLAAFFVSSFANEIRLIDRETFPKREFKISGHKKINEEALAKVLSPENISKKSKGFRNCQKMLTSTQWRQDIFLFFHSKAHFDNCEFNPSFRYINRLLKENREYSERAARATSNKKRNKQYKKIMRNAGKILHAIQDFYSHSNYVENSSEKYVSLNDVPALRFWTLDEQNQILKLAKKKLETGTVWWGFPKGCRKGVDSHGTMEKDSAGSQRGKKETNWIDSQTKQKITNYEAALALAEKSSYEFLIDVFEKHGGLKEYCS